MSVLELEGKSFGGFLKYLKELPPEDEKAADMLCLIAIMLLAGATLAVWFWKVF